MLLTCPECETSYEIDPTQLGARGHDVRCTACGFVWYQRPLRDAPPRAPQAEEEPQAPVPDIEFADPPRPEPEPVPESVLPREESDIRIVIGGEDQAQDLPLRTPPWAFGALVFLCLLNAAILILMAVQGPAVRAFPRLAAAYSLIGVTPSVPARGLEITNLAAEQRIAPQSRTLRVSALLTNAGQKHLEPPRLEIVLQDAAGKEIQRWDVPAGALNALKAGESAPLKLELDNPPEGGATLVLRVKERG